MKKIIIVGGGMAGLSLAYECLLQNCDVTVVEKDSVTGGLSKSITHNKCRLDMGVHIMYLKDKQVFQKIKEIVSPDKLIKIKRKGKLYLKKRYVDWPLKFTAAYQLPFSFSLRIIIDQLTKKKIKNKKDNKKDNNFHDELLSLYGPTLYYSFFHPLTKKFLRTDPKEIHSNWAFSSLRAATKIEDKAFAESYKYLTKTTNQEAKQDFNIVKFLINSLTTSRKDEPFYYFKNGFGILPESYEEKILKMGGKIRTKSQVDSFVIKNNKIQKCVINGKKHDVDQVVWTGNPYDLCNLLGIEYPKFQFLHSKYVYFFLKKCNKNHQVCYYADSDISFSRGTILSNHSKTIIHNEKINDVLCLAYSFKSKANMQNSFNSLKEKAIADLKKVKLINDESAIESTFEINAPYSYPILTKDYQKNLAALQKNIAKFRNIMIFGRQATFNYDNVDVIIKESINHPIFNS